MRQVYLDNAATTAVRPEVLDAMLPYFTDVPGNAASLHMAGQRAKRALEGARETVAAALGARPSEVFFTSGGTESDNQAIVGAAEARRERGRHIVTSAIEHHAVLHTCQGLEARGFSVTYLPVDGYGRVDPAELRAALRDDTILVSLMLANNELGTLQPVTEAATVARERGVLFHTDAVQAAGKMALDVNDLGLDLLSLAAHKVHGPKGVGVLYVRRGTPLLPLLRGGQQESSLRPGTSNVAGAVGLATALDLAQRELSTEPARLGSLRDRLEAGAAEQVGDVALNGHPTLRLPNIANLSFAGVEGEALLMALDIKGVAVSTGSACAAGAAESSHVLRALNLPPERVRGSLRFSFGHLNDEADVDYALEALAEAVPALRRAGAAAARLN
jgi:cysteine desulfurase